MRSVGQLLFLYFHILISWHEIIFAISPLIIYKYTVQYLRDMCLIRLQQNNEMLKGTVTCTDIHFSDIFTDGFLHALHSLLYVLNIHGLIRLCIHCHKDKAAAVFITRAEVVHVLIYLCKLTVIEI